MWWASLPEPWGRRPVLLVARNEAYEVLTWVMVAPITTRVRPISTQVPLDPTGDGVPRPCAVVLDNVQAVRVAWLGPRIGRLRQEKMEAVDRGLHAALGLRD